jgi:hypothetical protein
MALSDDQRALLRLLAQREEGYEDIAALKGLSVAQVRAEVKDALAELQAMNEPPPAPAAPPPRAEQPPSPQAAQKEEEQEPPPPSTEAKKLPVRRPRPGIPAERRRLLLLTGGALGIVAVVLIAIALFSGDSGSDADPLGASGVAAENAAVEDDKVTQAVLSPVEGSDASGRAVFGRVGKEEIVLQVTGEDLEPTDKGESYTVWLYRNPKLTLRVGSVPVGEEGNLGARFTIPAELLAYVASGAFNQIYVSRTDNSAYQREIARAKRSKTLPRYIGETVMSGEITGPIAKGAGKQGG